MVNRLLLQRFFSILLLAVGSVNWVWPLAEPDLDRAHSLYQRTQYHQALEILEPTQPKTAASYALLGQCYYMLEDYKKASEAFQKAVDADRGNSVYWDWLGRAYGKRAETSSFLTAPSYASKTRQYFEKAVELDAANLDAADDLIEYYLEAPGFLGGGAEKAAQLSERIRSRAPARYHSMQARLAEKDKKPAVAEQHWRAAVEAAPEEAGRLIDLARFLARQGRHSESDAAFEQAAHLAPDSVQLKFQRARTYIDSQRNLDQARALLQEYLNSPLTPDDPPRADAQKLLQKIVKG
ncbi:MAG: tetratricopeptide repeat protein [Acidobacteria bacterium]|nr:tetratricopeptide repeat protein [Acidobacteriota bacterium]